MNKDLRSFKVNSEGKILDYRISEKLSLNEIEAYFKKNGYKVRRIWNGNRHMLGVLTKAGVKFFLKLSTSVGISVVTQDEYNWNNFFLKYFPKDLLFKVPISYSSGFYQDKYFYLITDYFDGKLLCEISDTYRKSDYLTQYLPQIIELSEQIQKLPSVDFLGKANKDYRKIFLDKVNNWFVDIPVNIQQKYKIKILLDIVKNGVNELSGKPRHGDFTPWHMIELRNHRLGLIDGEHASPFGIENYDICYFIQRVFSVLKNPEIAKDIHSKLLLRGYEADKLKIILAARAIGGFLDESLNRKANYAFADDFSEWVQKT